MEEFKKRLYKEWIELGYRTHQNALFIHHNPKFKGLGPHLQMAQLKQYFAQMQYLEALEYRVHNILLPDERREMETEIGKEFAEKFKGCTLFITSEKTEEFISDIKSASCGYVDDANGKAKYLGVDRMYDLICNDGHIRYANSTYHISKPYTPGMEDGKDAVPPKKQGEYEGASDGLCGEPQGEAEGEDIGNVPCEMSEEDLKEAHQAGIEKPTKADPYSREFQDARD